MATTGNTNCFCGNEVLAPNVLVPESKCKNAWSVYEGGLQESPSNSASMTTPHASTFATSGSMSVPNIKLATATLASTASVSSTSTSPSTPTSGAGGRYGLF